MSFHIEREPPPLREPDRHTYGPESERNYDATRALLARTPACRYCGHPPALVAGPGTEWHLNHAHEAGCPAEAEPEVEPVRLTDGDSVAAYMEAERVWDTEAG